MINIVQSAIMGFCVGDALGVPVEFYKRRMLENNPVEGLRAYGTHNQPLGTWSDDTSLTLCTMESLLEGYNTNNMADLFVKWYTEGKWTPHGGVFDIGISTRYALQRRMEGVSATSCGGDEEEDNGNGSLMRMFPLALYCREMEEDNRYLIVEEVSSITHRHGRSILGCQILVELAINLSKGMPKVKAYEITISNIRRDFGSHPEIDAYEAFLSGSLLGMSKEDIKSGGYVVDTLAASVWSLLNTNTYTASVLCAVNLGGDTDTIGAITGGLAGLVYGADSIPSEWVSNIVQLERISDLCDRFLEHILLNGGNIYGNKS